MNEPFAPLKTLDPELLEQLQTRLPGPLFETLSGSLSCDQQRLERLERENRLLRDLRRLALLKKYGPAAEHLSDEQLELLEVEPGVSVAEVAAEGHREPVAAPPKPVRPHPGRQTLPAQLPRREQVIACPPEQCVCGQCGRPTVVIGYEESEQLDLQPAQYFVVVTKREKTFYWFSRGVL